MLRDSDVQPMLPVKDLKRAEEFYQRTLGLEQVGDESSEAVIFRTGHTTLCVYRSQYAGTNKGTAAVWEVRDIESTVDELKGKGVKFEHYDMPGMSLQGDIHASGDFKVAWFKDPDGNILSVQTAMV